MRLFIAVRFTPALRRALTEAQADLRRQGAVGNFTAPENLHLTLAFLGETEKAAAARAALEEAWDSRPLTLQLRDGGCFGDVLWAGVEPSARLTALERDLCGALRRRGFILEERPFRPHITLVRELRAPKPPVLHLTPAAMTVTRISLLESCRESGRPVYREVAGKDARGVSDR